jgi:mycofactocin precursor
MVENTVPAPPVIDDPVKVVEVDDTLVEADLLVEDISIDGMCGVY